MTKKRLVDYNRGKKTSNPFVKKRKKRVIAWKKILGTVMILGVIGGTIWFLFFYSVWDIKTIEVKGNQRVSAAPIKEVAQEQTRKKKWFFLNQKNLLLFEGEKVKQKLEDRYHFPQISIDKDIPDKITIDITENQCLYIFKQDHNYYKVDHNNYIIEKIEKPKSEHPIIIDNRLSINKIKDDRVVLNREYLDYVLKLKDYIDKKDKKIDIKKFLLEENIKDDLQEKNTVKMVLESGPVAHMSMGKPPEEQVERLLVLKEKKLKNDFSTKDYIILKYGKIFYK